MHVIKSIKKSLVLTVYAWRSFPDWNSHLYGGKASRLMWPTWGGRAVWVFCESIKMIGFFDLLFLFWWEEYNETSFWAYRDWGVILGYGRSSFLLKRRNCLLRYMRYSTSWNWMERLKQHFLILLVSLVSSAPSNDYLSLIK